MTSMHSVHKVREESGGGGGSGGAMAQAANGGAAASVNAGRRRHYWTEESTPEAARRHLDLSGFTRARPVVLVRRLERTPETYKVRQTQGTAF